MRAYFFGKDSTIKWRLKELIRNIPSYHHNIDIRNENKLETIFKNNKFVLIIHAVAQPSHEWSAKKPRIGDHLWYITDVSKFRKHYPKWDYKYNIDDILKEICTKQAKIRRGE